MSGERNETDASELGRWRIDWAVVLLAVLFVALFVVSFLAGGGCAQGADVDYTPGGPVDYSPGSSAKPKETPKPAPPKIIGWTYPMPDGSVLFVPVQPVPVGGPAPDRPFAQGSGSTLTTSATDVVGVSSWWIGSRPAVGTFTAAYAGTSGNIDDCPPAG